MIPMLQEVDRTERLLHLTPRGSYGDWNPGEGPYEFHRRLPGCAPSPLREADVLAAEFGLERLWVKDESLRFGLPAFKVLGASWATYRALDRRLRAVTGSGFGRWYDLADLSSAVEPLRPLTLTCATDGNHGRAVAHMARRLGLEALIYVPLVMSEARRDAISGEGAQVVEVDGTYDDAVRLAALEQTPDRLVIADTSWPGYEDVPRWVIDGYSTIIREIETHATEHNVTAPDLVVVQIGVGALAASVIAAVRRWLGESVFILGVEPTQAASTLASLEAGRLVQIPGPHDSIMAGLNCG
jgi:diaminopropionate ammonia-lyase